MKRARRVLSHHGSDCPSEPHPFRSGRCIILTRIDRPGELSRAWCTGDCAEGRVYKRHDHTFDRRLPVWYGGGFWERVEITAKKEDR
jgi:hypothetical protein